MAETERVPFVPLGPADLSAALALWIDRRSPGRQRIGIDGLPECGATTLADVIAEHLAALGRPVVRSSTSWWWRPAALRLEQGREDVDSLLTGWVDRDAVQRELLDPLGPGGSGQHITALRDPVTDRSVRRSRTSAPDTAVLLMDGPLLFTLGLPWEAVVHLQVSPATVKRALTADRQWWSAAFRRYEHEDRPVEQADVVVSYDHPSAPAVDWGAAPAPGGRAVRR